MRINHDDNDDDRKNMISAYEDKNEIPIIIKSIIHLLTKHIALVTNAYNNTKTVKAFAQNLGNCPYRI